MAKQAGETQEQELDLVDAFKWDLNDGDGIFETPEPKKTKEEKQEEVLEAIKKDGKGKKKEDGTGGDIESEYEPFSEDQHEKPESKTHKGTEGEGTKGKATTEGSGITEPEEHGDLTEQEQEVKFFTTLAKELKDKSILTLDLEEGDEIDEEKFFELQEAEIQARADEIFEDVFEQVKQDPDAVAFLKFKRAGGNTSEFFKTFRDNTTFPENLDLEKKENQLKVLRHYLLSIGVDEEELADEIERATEKGKVEILAKKHFKKVTDTEIANKLAMIEQQEKRVKKMQEDAVKTRDALQKIVLAGVGEGNFKFTKEEQKELVPYLTKPTVKVGANRFITSFQAELGEIMSDPKKMLTLAKIIKKKFDLPDITKAAETVVTNKIKSKLLDSKRDNKSRSTMSGEKSLADMFGD